MRYYDPADEDDYPAMTDVCTDSGLENGDAEASFGCGTFILLLLACMGICVLFVAVAGAAVR